MPSCFLLFFICSPVFDIWYTSFLKYIIPPMLRKCNKNNCKNAIFYIDKCDCER
nr:MAG TPA: hypothetical protein [Caudoviricetes sp.]